MPLNNAERQRLHRQKQRYLVEAERGARLTFAEQRGVDNKVTEEQRVERALKYARWRWDSFHAGVTVSL